jgi:hypothetical protein
MEHPTLYLDEDTDADYLIALLRREAYSVISPREVGGKGWSDEAILDYCAQLGYVVLTSNPADFEAIHEQWSVAGRFHAGILSIYRANNPKQDLTYAEIVKALGNLLRSGLPLANEIHCLNFWL